MFFYYTDTYRKINCVAGTKPNKVLLIICNKDYMLHSLKHSYMFIHPIDI